MPIKKSTTQQQLAETRSWEDILSWFRNLRKSLDETPIKTDVAGNALYQTTIHLDGGITNEFPSEKPGENDVYWKRHNDQVDKVLATKKEILMKILDIIKDVIPSVPT